jgi:SAM-dependent methyltransferase
MAMALDVGPVSVPGDTARVLKFGWPGEPTWRKLVLMSSVIWDSAVAGFYDDAYAALFERSVLGPLTGLLAELARGGPAVEFAVGTGRVALALAARGITVHGIELSRPMAERLSAKPGAAAVPVIIGDMTTARVPGTFKLVYLVANTIMNVTTQDDQLAVFANAAAHLERGGYFVAEVVVPQLRRVPPGETARVLPSIPIMSASRPSTTWRARSRGRITGSRRTGAWCATPRPTATSGRHLRQRQPGRGIREAAIGYFAYYS